MGRVFGSSICGDAMNMIRRILESPCASYWLKNAVQTASQRDIVDALRDAETLLAALQECWHNVSGGLDHGS